MPVAAGDPLIVQVLGWPFVLALVLLLCAALLAFVIVLGNTESRNTVVERLRALDHQTFTRGGMMEVGRCASMMCRKTYARGHAHMHALRQSLTPPPLLTDPDKCRRAEWQRCRKSSGAVHRNARSSDSSEPRVPMVLPMSHALGNVSASGAWAEVCMRPDLPPLDAC